ncbi:MAG: hypothetical protein H0T89_10100 [Deltaproteobacteria bacterium]|nr:hypothetical protein [Deltaproteobacteria bacterium]MDQ3301247.1 hypothetical protein [Myxococcota bacterium]
MRRAIIDDRLGARVRSVRPLVYTDTGDPDDDRPPHVRAASGIAVRGEDLLVIQDDASFIARVRGDDVTAIALPRGAGGRRRFEIALGNKLDKLDLEACVVVDGELWAFGSGSLPVRETICRLIGDAAEQIVIVDGSRFYAGVRDALGSLLNIEGVACVGDELWLFHRGNTGPADRGPAVARVELAGFRRFLAGDAPPAVRAVDRYDLGEVSGIRIGFTDACAFDDRVFFVAAAEASIDAIADGLVLASQLGVIEGDVVRAIPLAIGGAPCKVEGLALTLQDRAWIAVDPDDAEVPTQLHEVDLIGPWRGSSHGNH